MLWQAEVTRVGRAAASQHPLLPAGVFEGIIKGNMALRLARLLILGLLLPSVALACTYTIKSGDILYNIAQACRTTVDNLYTLNPGITATALYVGQASTSMLTRRVNQRKWCWRALHARWCA